MTFSHEIMHFQPKLKSDFDFLPLCPVYTLLSCGFVQAFVRVSMINPQRSTPYFSVQLSVYDGDTFLMVVDRVRRTSGVPGECKQAASVSLSVFCFVCSIHSH